MDYEINKDTLAIMPKSEEESRVLENDIEYDVSMPTLSVIERSCEYFGSTYEGRYVGTKNISGITHKSPIIIEDTNKIIFFPTTSPNRPDCVWISLNNILSYEKGKRKGTSKIIFKNGNTLDLNISIGSLNNQIMRSSRLKYLLEERQEKFK